MRSSRREILKGSVAVGLALTVPDWMLPALAQGEVVVPFTVIPETFPVVTGADRRINDIRTIDGPFTPADRFFTLQHYGHPEVDPAAWRLKISGLVERERSLSLDDLKKMRASELVRVNVAPASSER